MSLKVPNQSNLPRCVLGFGKLFGFELAFRVKDD